MKRMSCLRVSDIDGMVYRNGDAVVDIDGHDNGNDSGGERVGGGEPCGGGEYKSVSRATF